MPPIRIGTWITEAVDSASDDFVGRYNSIALDAEGKAHISYSTGEAGLKYATNKTGTWITETVDSAGYDTSIALDAEGKAHISYSLWAPVFHQ